MSVLSRGLAPIAFVKLDGSFGHSLVSDTN